MLRNSAGRIRRPLIAAVALALLVLVLWLCRVPLIRGLGTHLVVDDMPKPAAAIVLLLGEEDTRPFRAAEIFRAGHAPRILVGQVEDRPASRPDLRLDSTRLTLRILADEGIPREAIQLLVPPDRTGVASTVDEAAAVRAWWASHQPLTPNRLLLVTSACHTRRARWVFRKALRQLDNPPELLCSPAPHFHFEPRTWWQNEFGLITVFEEYVKLFYYRWKYRGLAVSAPERPGARVYSEPEPD